MDCACRDLPLLLLVGGSFLSSGRLPAMDQAGTSSAPSAPLLGTFLGLALDMRSDKLYDLVQDIPDVMGLRALRPSAAIVKVISVPDSRCIRVVTPDDHVNIGFHEVLLHDMEDEDFVALSELNYLRLDWPKTLFVFMSRYQCGLERMGKDCRERFGGTQSGNCTHCGKYIQQNLGKHIALYHMELAQLWRCPVTWCTVWKGTAQDCVDHMRRTHDIPPLVKAANLAHYWRAVDGHDTANYFRSGDRYSVIQPHWGPVISPLSDHQSSRNSCGFQGNVYATIACVSG